MADRTEAVEVGATCIAGALRCAAADQVSVDELTGLLQLAFRCRHQIDAAVSDAIGALDRAAHKADEGELTMGLHVPDWLSGQLHVSSSAGYALARQARELPSLPQTSAAFDRGDISGQQAGVVSRCVQAVQRGGGDTVEAERLLLGEAQTLPREVGGVPGAAGGRGTPGTVMEICTCVRSSTAATSCRATWTPRAG